MPDRDLAALADPAQDQYFLTNPAKLQVILDAAEIRSSDRVVELGAGAGTVARALPQCDSLTLIELDERLVPTLRANAPDGAVVLNSDGIAILNAGSLVADVILGNLPTSVTAQLVALLPELPFRVAVLAAGSLDPFEDFTAELEYTVLTEIRGTDFTPPQPSTSLLVRVERAARPSSTTF